MNKKSGCVGGELPESNQRRKYSNIFVIPLYEVTTPLSWLAKKEMLA